MYNAGWTGMTGGELPNVFQIFAPEVAEDPDDPIGEEKFCKHPNFATGDTL
jgi:hypothetical protein